MLSQEIRDRVDRRLQELYERHLSLHEDEVAGYYDSGVGYRKPEVPSMEQGRFSVCLASTDGEVFVAGDHDEPFALQSISKTFPGKLGIGVFSPGLDAYGNSVRGTAVCEEISERLGLHVFADAREDTLFGPGR
jgi:glutaminase